MRQYPVILNLNGRQVLVVGGGKVAERKIEKLLDTGGIVTVVSPTVTSVIRALASQDKIKWIERKFEVEDIGGVFLIIAATNQRKVNLQVGEASTTNQLINLVDDPKRSNFSVPSSLHRGKLTISVSTSGASPGLSKKITKELSNQFDDVYESYLEFLYESRLTIQKDVQDPALKEQMLKTLLEPEFLELTRKEQYAEREKRFLALYLKGGNFDE